MLCDVAKVIWDMVPWKNDRLKRRIVIELHHRDPLTSNPVLLRLCDETPDVCNALADRIHDFDDCIPVAEGPMTREDTMWM